MDEEVTSAILKADPRKVEKKLQRRVCSGDFSAGGSKVEDELEERCDGLARG